MFSIQSLPKIVSLNVLLVFLSSEELSRLDSATCNKLERIGFLNLLSYGKHKIFTRLSSTNVFPIGYLFWLMLRNIKTGGEMVVTTKAVNWLAGIFGLESFESLSSISILRISQCVDLKGLFFLLNECQSLQKLSLHSLFYINWDIMGCCSDLIEVDFSFTDCLDDSMIAVFCDNHPNITSFNASFCEGFNFDCIYHVCNTWKLKALIIAVSNHRCVECPAIELRRTLECILSTQTCLSALNVSGFNFDDALDIDLMVQILGGNETLTFLDISCCFKLLSRSFSDSLCVYCPNLTELHVQGRKFLPCNPFSSDSIIDVSRKLNKLLSLNMFTTVLDILTVTELVSNLPFLSKIFISNLYTVQGEAYSCLVLASVFKTVSFLDTSTGFKIAGERVMPLKRFTVDDARSLYAECSSVKIDAHLTIKDVYSVLPEVHEVKTLCFATLSHFIPRFLHACCHNLISIHIILACDDCIMEHISESCILLESLTLASCAEVHDRSLIKLCRKLPLLSKLVLGNMENISNNGLIGIAKSVKHLSVLELSQMNVTPAGVKALISANRRLTHVEIMYCAKIKSDGKAGSKFREEVGIMLPNLNILIVK